MANPNQVLGSTLIATVLPRLQSKWQVGMPSPSVSTTMRSALTKDISRVVLPLDMNPFQTTLSNDPNLIAALAVERHTVLVEESHMLDVEADVERALCLYAVHDINLILGDYLNIRYPNRNRNKKLTCRMQHHTSSSRVDVVWKYGITSVLVLEVKRCGILVEADWEDAVAANVAAARVKVDRCNAEHGLFSGSVAAGRLMQQSTQYMKAFDVPYVLLFDWNNMVLLDLLPVRGQNGGADQPHDNWNHFAGYFFSNGGVVGIRDFSGRIGDSSSRHS
ncbi:hypothetical protein C8R43DRAFT_1139190 [Mycena crocata]|nr:hypothetical protein C8R43DRAFT_1139190 [Mycena crocata]